MTTTRDTNQKMAISAAIFVPLAYLFFYTPYGMDTTDFGYFYAYPWRILQGQVPYRDFFYIKPALPLYWHAFWLWLTPQSLQVLGGKAGFLISMLLSSWFGALAIARFFRLHSLPLPLLATCGFVFGVHSFPHMPWHTVDGVLFSSSALWLASCGNGCLAGLMAVCAMLCKQSFLPVPAGILAILWIWNPGHKAFYSALGCMLAALCGALLFIESQGALQDMLNMTTGQLAMQEALDAGIFIYLRQNFWLPAVSAMPWLLWRLAGQRPPQWLLPTYLYCILLCLFYIFNVLSQKTWIGFGASWPTLFMLLGLTEILFPRFFLAHLLKNPSIARPGLSASIPFGSLLAASWCVAISGGYKIPAFFAVPLVFAFFVCHVRLGGKTTPLAWLLLACGLLMFGFGYQYPYTFPVRPLAKGEMIYDAGDIYPQAAHVRIDKNMYERLAELKELRSRYGANYKTLPGFSMSYYLNGDRPIIGSDWLIDWEINGKTEKLYKELLDKNVTVFMERDQLETEKADNYERAGYSVPQMVRKNWRIVDETPYFVIFQPPRQ